MEQEMSNYLRYLRYEKNSSLHTIEAYKNDLWQLYQFLLKYTKCDLPTIHSQIIRQWIKVLIEKKYSPYSIHRKLSAVKSFFKYLCRTGYLKINPIKLVVAPKKGKILPTFILEREINQLLFNSSNEETFENRRDRTILDVFYSTGIRCVELAQLKDQDINFESLYIKVIGKRNKQRLIPFSKILKEVLILYQIIRDKTFPHSPRESFFIRKNGLALNNNMIYHIVRKKLSILPNISKRSPHVFRHTFATDMLNNGANLNAVKELLGHSSLASTEVYTHMTFEKLKKVYSQAHPRA